MLLEDFGFRKGAMNENLRHLCAPSVMRDGEDG
jgi:hypothetical protein